MHKMCLFIRSEKRDGPLKRVVREVEVWDLNPTPNPAKELYLHPNPGKELYLHLAVTAGGSKARSKGLSSSSFPLL